MTETIAQIASARRLSSADYCVQAEIIETLESANARAQEILAEAETAAKQQREETETELAAYRETVFAQAEADAQARLDSLLEHSVELGTSELLSFGEAIQKDYQSTHVWLAALVRTALHKVLGSMEKDEFYHALITTAVKDFGKRWHYSLITSPSDLAHLETLLARHPMTNIEAVTADPSMDEGTLHLVGPAGVVDASLSVQLAHLDAYILDLVGEGQ